MREEKGADRGVEELETTRTKLAADDLTEESFVSVMRAWLVRAREESLGLFGWVEWHGKAMLAPVSDFGGVLEREIGETEQGRLFWKGGEIRWKRQEDEFRVVFLGEDAEPLGLPDKTEDLKREGLDRGATFWADLEGGHLFGRSMSVKLPEERRWSLQIAEYRRKDRSLCFSRYCDLGVRTIG